MVYEVNYNYLCQFHCFVLFFWGFILFFIWNILLCPQEAPAAAILGSAGTAGARVTAWCGPGLLPGCTRGCYLGKWGTVGGATYRLKGRLGCAGVVLAGWLECQVLFNPLPLHWDWEQVSLCTSSLRA